VALTVAHKRFVHTANTNSTQILQKVSMHMCMYVPHESKTGHFIRSHVDRFLKFFHIRQLKIPPHLTSVVAVPSESLVFKN